MVITLPERGARADPDHKRPGTAQLGTEAPHAGETDLPLPCRPAPTGDSAGNGAECVVGEQTPLPGHDAEHGDRRRPAGTSVGTATD